MRRQSPRFFRKLGSPGVDVADLLRCSWLEEVEMGKDEGSKSSLLFI